MKKIFPWIVVLITLSLIGIIFIQVNWIRNAISMRREQYNQHMFQVLDRVRTDLVNNKHIQDDKGPRKYNAGVSIGGNILRNYLPDQMIPVSDRYSADELKKIIAAYLKEEDIQVPFEFAIVADHSFISTPEVYSPRFFQHIRDTVHYKQFYTYLVKDQTTLSAMIGALNKEMLYLLVPADSYTYIVRSMSWIISGSILFTLIIITAFALTVFAMLRQKKLSEIKSDFINNMTHEFKTPLATISLAVDAISNDKVVKDKDKIRYFSGIIKEENKRMHKQVETILQSALLDRQEIRLNRQEINLHEIIEKSVQNLELQLKDRGGEVVLHLDAANPVLTADEVHFSNMISNLLDNALKYSRDHPRIVIHTANHKKSLVISVADNGIGMSRETMSRIFEKFYRAHTGNLHNVKGFGLGLAYVKTIVDAHEGKIRVESTQGKGSKFEMEFPQA